MAVLRPTLVMLGRGSSASVGGRGMEINKVFRHAAPPLHPAVIRNAEGCRHFSSGPDKAESGLRMWWQRARNRVKNANLEERARVLFVYTLVVVGTPSVLAVRTRNMYRRSAGEDEDEGLIK